RPGFPLSCRVRQPVQVDAGVASRRGVSSAKRGTRMLGHMVLMAAMIGQTAGDGQRTGPVLSEQAKKAQARALAEFRANEHTIQPRLTAWYQLENERLVEKIETVNIATGRALSFGAGGRDGYGAPGGAGGFSSVPPTGNLTTSTYRAQPSLPELKRENLLLKWRLGDSRYLHREANRLYGLEYSIRHVLARSGVR